MPDNERPPDAEPEPMKPRLPPASKSSLAGIFEWIGRYETSVLVVVVLAVSAIWLFVEIADEVRDGDTLSLDQWAVQALRHPDNPRVPIGPDWLGGIGRDVTALGGVTFLALLTMSVVGYLWLRKMYAAGLLVLGITISASLLSVMLKGYYQRPRPELVPHLTGVYTSSFPSGHAMLSTVVFLTLGTVLGRFTEERRLRAYFLCIALALCFLVGVSRVYMGVHYPTDVLAGWVAGMIWGLVCWLVTYELQRRGYIEWRQVLEREDHSKSETRSNASKQK